MIETRYLSVMLQGSVYFTTVQLMQTILLPYSSVCFSMTTVMSHMCQVYLWHCLYKVVQI
jgi:hypothetical protein